MHVFDNEVIKYLQGKYKDKTENLSMKTNNDFIISVYFLCDNASASTYN